MEKTPDIIGHLDPPAPSATVVDRIKYLIRFSRLTQLTFSQMIGVDPGSLSRVLGGKVTPSEGFINRIVVNMGVSKEWLTSGTNVPFPRAEKKKESPRIAEGAAVYDIDVTAGPTMNSRMFTEDRVIGRLSLPGINPEFPIVRVSGDSMSPRLRPGCYISIRRIDLQAPIAWGSIYVVVLPDYRLVKYVRRNADPAMVTLHSANPEYDDIEVRRDDIEGLYIVENVINFDAL